MPFEHQLRILHLSDLHERVVLEWMDDKRKAKVRLSDATRRQVLDDSNFLEVIKKEIGQVDLVCFTGDAADWGLADEFKKATGRLDDILKASSVSRDRLFLVPGNHDIQRKKAEQSWEQMRKLASMPLMANAFSDWMGGMDAPFGAQEAWREEIAQRVDDFWKWVEFDLGRACLLPRNSAHRRLGYRVRVDGLSLPFDVHVIGFDSAWLCGDEHDTGKLRLTPGQVNLLIQGENVPSQVGFRLALVHHPLSALADDNQCSRLLANGVDLLLHGHQHDPIAKVLSDPDRQRTVLATGSLYADEGDRWINAFHLIEAYLDDQGQPLRYRVTFWGYSDRGHWYRTGAIYKNAVDGVLELPARVDLQLRGATPATGSADRADSIGARDLNNPSMPLATLQALLIERLSRPDVGRLWHAVLETRMDDEMGQRSKSECVIELIQQAKSRDKLPRVTEELRKIGPDLVGPLGGSSDHASATPVSPPQSAPISNIPDRNPFFTGREQVLAQLQEALAAQGRAALSGLGGIGKTQTVLEYAHRHFDEYLYTFRALAASREALDSGYAMIAGLLQLPASDVKDQTVIVDAVKRWLSSNQCWLLILDNAAEPDSIKPFMPLKPTGHILLTSRAHVLDTIGIVNPIELNEMPREEAQAFLLKRTGRGADGGVEAKAASELTLELGFLPLALEQAGAFIAKNQSHFQNYLKSFRQRKLELLSKHGPVTGDYPESVRTTWSMNFRQLEMESEAAADLLRLSAFLSPDNIPLEFLAEGAPELGDVLSAALVGAQEDPLVLDETLTPLRRFSLIRRDIETRSYSVHRLVQAVVRDELDLQTQRLWAERAVRAVNRAFPHVEFSTWPLCERLLSQAHICAELINHWGFEFPEAAQLLNNAGFYLFKRGRYTDAEPLYQRALAIREKALGPEHPDVATSLNNLARLYGRQGQYAKAEPLYQRALTIREKALSDVARSLNSLATLHVIQGQYAKAEPLYQRALAIWEKTLGPEHPDVATSLNTGALLYKNQGQYAKAEAPYQRALAIREKTLGPEHPKVATSLSNLAGLYQSMGDCAKAEPLYQRALAFREKAFGPEHPDVAASLNELAGIYNTQGQYAKAEALYQRALEIYEKALGPEHPYVATCLENYALCLRAMDRSQEAEPVEARARTIRAKLR